MDAKERSATMITSVLLCGSRIFAATIAAAVVTTLARAFSTNAVKQDGCEKEQGTAGLSILAGERQS